MTIFFDVGCRPIHVCIVLKQRLYNNNKHKWRCSFRSEVRIVYKNFIDVNKSPAVKYCWQLGSKPPHAFDSQCMRVQPVVIDVRVKFTMSGNKLLQYALALSGNNM